MDNALVLAIDTSAPVSVALIEATVARGGKIQECTTLAQLNGDDSRRHIEDLHPYINQVISNAGRKTQEITDIVIGRGPGPFTGLRVGIAAAKVLGLAWNVPVHGISSLDALAYEVIEKNPEIDEFIVSSDARRKEIYWAPYAYHTTTRRVYRTRDIQVTSPEEVHSQLPVFGFVAQKYPELFSCLDEKNHVILPRAEFLGKAALTELFPSGISDVAVNLNDTSPLYLRGSDAQVPAPQSMV